MAAIFWGGPKHFQESVGGQIRTWWGQHHDPKKLHPYCKSEEMSPVLQEKNKRTMDDMNKTMRCKLFLLQYYCHRC